MERLVSLRAHWLIGRLAREALLVFGLDVPAKVIIGEDFKVMHRGMGTVLHPSLVIGNRVTLYHQVTIGRADAHIKWEHSPMEKIVLEDDVIIFAGAKVLGGPGTTTLGEGTIVAANAVLTKSTGKWEIWGGIPARRIGIRRTPDL